MEIKPHRKLFYHALLSMFTVTFFMVLFGFIFLLLISLDDKVDLEQAGPVFWPVIGVIVLISWIISIPIIILWIKNLTYYIEDDRITICKGILKKVQKNIPYRAITDFILQRSLYDRFLGIGAIRIQTAGQSPSGTGYEGHMAGLIQYEELHQQLRDKVKRLHPLSESTTVAEEAAPKPQKGELQEILAELKAIRKAVEKKSE